MKTITITDQKIRAKDAYRELIDHILNELVQIDEELPWQEFPPDWWLDMMRINRLVQECKQNLGAIE